MAPPRGSAAYKKKEGILAVSKDSQSLSWTPVAPPGSKPALTLAVSTITNLQQTPATSAKVMLKIFAQTPGTSNSDTHVFSFTSPSAARAEAEAIKDALSTAIQSAKSGGGLPTALGEGGASSAAMAIASAMSSDHGASRNTNGRYDDASLKEDGLLQRSLLAASPSLSKTFVEASRTKPDSLTNSKFASQFWSTRIHLLRAHAIEKNQTRGSYNVLSTMKSYTEDNASKMTISKEQIQLIFNQHALVKRVYDENVPKLSESAFWSRFFQSRLFKKLKGEKIDESDALDNILDKYLQYNDDTARAKFLIDSHVPHIIDVEGNENNHSQRKGNRPDQEMRTKSKDSVPIYRTLNAISEKILSHVAPNDIDPSLPIGVDEETFNALALRDLQGDPEENRVILNIKDQGRFFNSDKGSGVSADALLYAKQNPAKVLKSLQSDLARVSSNMNLEATIGVDDDSDSSDDDDSSLKKRRVGSKASRAAATSQMIAAMSEQRAQSDDLSASSTSFTTVQTSSTSGLSTTIFDSLSVTHATATEFLQQFWSAFLSGDPTRVDEIGKGLETLNRAMERIKAVANDAEVERRKEIDRMKKQVQDYLERTGKKRNVDYESVAGGAKAVNQLLAPTVKAIDLATKEYRKAMAEQSKAAA